MGSWPPGCQRAGPTPPPLAGGRLLHPSQGKLQDFFPQGPVQVGFKGTGALDVSLSWQGLGPQLRLQEEAWILPTMNRSCSEPGACPTPRPVPPLGTREGDSLVLEAIGELPPR